MIKDMLDVYKK